MADCSSMPEGYAARDEWTSHGAAGEPAKRGSNWRATAPLAWDDRRTLLAAASPVDQLARILGGVGLVFLVVGVALVAFTRINRRRRAAFAARAQTAPGEVVDNVWRDVGRSTEVTLLAFPRLRYRLPDGTVVEQLSFEGASPPVARPGSTVEVLYDPADPRRARIAQDGSVHRALPTFLVVMGAIFAVLGAAMVAGAIAIVS